MSMSPDGRTTMPQQIAPIAVRPSTLTGISEWMIVSHYENNYGNAVRTLNAVRRELAALDAGAPPYRLRGLKSDELSLMGSVALHELYFGNLGGFRRAGPNSGLGRPDWHEVPDELAAEIATDFGSASAWRREFVGMAQSLAGGSGWVLLTYSRRQKRFWNQIATDHTQAAVDAAPVLVLDMYEHAYQMDFDVNATAYIDTFFRNINWVAVLKRIEAARNHLPPPTEDPSSTTDMPSLSVEELTAQIGQRQRRTDRRRAAAGPHVAPRGSDGGRDVARSGSRRGVDRRADAGQAGGRLLRLRLRRRAQRDEDPHRAWLRRALRPRRHRGVVRLGRRARAPTAGRMSAEHVEPRRSLKPRIQDEKGDAHAAGDRADRGTPLDAERNLGANDREPLREQLRGVRADAECGARRACRAGCADAGLSAACAQARGAGRGGLGHAPRAVLRQFGWPGQPDSRPGPRHARGALRKRGSMAPGIRGRREVARGWFGLGPAHVFAPGQAVLEPGCHGLLPGRGRRSAGPRARHVR